MAKNVLITGAASGMGLLLSQCYAREGANVAMADVNEEGLRACAEEIRGYPANVLELALDVRKYDEVERACGRVAEAFGGIDILINCAGGAECRILGVSGEFQNIPVEVFDYGIDLNLKGVIYFDHAVMKHMARQKSGVIIHLGSITGLEGCPDSVAYSASKSALMFGMTKSIALAGAKYNVRCVAIAPGPVLTRPGMANMKTMAGRAADPQEIVDLIMFAAGDKGRFINGTYILADGGRNVMLNKT